MSESPPRFRWSHFIVLAIFGVGYVVTADFFGGMFGIGGLSKAYSFYAVVACIVGTSSLLTWLVTRNRKDL